MPVTVASFKAQYPEFEEAGDPLIQAKLNDAAVNVDAATWGTEADAAVMLTAAHNLAISPFGRNTRLDKDDPTRSIYGEELKVRQRRVAFGLGRVS